MSSVLIVEDDLEVQSSLSKYLQAAKHDVICANSGSEGVELAKRNRFDAIVLDVRLPDFDGVDLAERLRDLPSLTMVPILFLTGNVDSHVMQAAHWMRGTSLLRKPCNPWDFISQLNDSLSEPTASVGLELASRTVESDPAISRANENTEPRPALLDLETSVAPMFDYEIGKHWNELYPPSTNGTAMPIRPVDLGELVDDVGHDARSSLFVLTEFASQAAAGLESPEHLERLRLLSVIEDRLVELTVHFDLLHAARRVHAGCAHHLSERISLDEFLSHAFADCGRLCRRKSCTVSGRQCTTGLIVNMRGLEARVALLGLFSHVLSITESGSVIHLQIQTDAGAADAYSIRVTIEAQTSADRAEFLAAVVASDRGFDPCSFETNPKLHLAAAVARDLGGEVRVDWLQRTFCAVISLSVSVAGSLSESK